MLQGSQTIAEKLKAMNYTDCEIIREYLLELDKKDDHYFEFESIPQSQKGDEDDDSDVDSDYESELGDSIHLENERVEHDRATLQSASVASIISGTMILDQTISTQSSEIKDCSQTSDNSLDVECTSLVLKKLKSKKMPQYVRNAISTTISNDLACGRHWIPVSTKNKKHQLYQRKVLRGKVTILWEKAIQFSPKLSSEDDYYVNVIRIWDIVFREASCQRRIAAIEKAWNQGEMKISTETLKPCLPIIGDDQSQKTLLSQTYKRVLPSSRGSCDILLNPPADPDSNQYIVANFYAFPYNIESLVSRSHKFDLAIKVWPEEHKIINMKTDGPTVVLGRSGTGKTTCCLYRMVKEFLNHTRSWNKHESTEGSLPLRQLFVTRNSFLVEKFETQFEKLIASHSLDRTCASVKDLRDLHYPLFLTWDKFLDLMDNSFRNGLCDNYDLLAIQGKKITADEFASDVWKSINRRICKNSFDPHMVWMEIKSFIKGYKPTRELSQEEYMELSARIAPNFAESREIVYHIYEQYKHYLGTAKRVKFNQLYDECDLVFHLFEVLKEHHDAINDWLFDSLYVDEVQDFTQSEVLLLIKSCKTTDSNIFLTGDTAQTVMRDVSFRFKDLKTSFFKDGAIATPLVHELTINYRSHSGILNLAGHVLTLLEKHFPNSVDRAPRDNGIFPGPIPKFIKCCHPDHLKLILGANVRNASESRFGHHQAVIVRTEECKKDIPFDENEVQIFSIYDCKV